METLPGIYFHEGIKLVDGGAIIDVAVAGVPGFSAWYDELIWLHNRVGCAVSFVRGGKEVANIYYHGIDN